MDPSCLYLQAHANADLERAKKLCSIQLEQWETSRYSTQGTESVESATKNGEFNLDLELLAEQPSQIVESNEIVLTTYLSMKTSNLVTVNACSRLEW